MTERIHVAAGVIVNSAGDILIAKRQDHLHQGGLWEFPGGKLEDSERVDDALKRELREELGINVQALRPLIRVHHDYPDKSVLLDVWRVDAFEGDAHGREGQPVEWVAPGKLGEYSFPAANLPIVHAAQLPDTCLVTPEPVDEQLFLSKLQASLSKGIKLVQLRAHSLDDSSYYELARQCLDMCHQYEARLLLNRDVEVMEKLDADGLHLTSSRMLACSERPVSGDKWLSVSCHSEGDIGHAESINADVAVVAPVKSTATHPHVSPMGWQQFQQLAERAVMPVYALGGMELSDMQEAWQNGAQGIAAIRGLWG